MISAGGRHWQQRVGLREDQAQHRSFVFGLRRLEIQREIHKHKFRETGLHLPTVQEGSGSVYSKGLHERSWRPHQKNGGEFEAGFEGLYGRLRQFRRQSGSFQSDKWNVASVALSFEKTKGKG